MTGPQPGVGSPIIQQATLRPTDVVREPGLDQQGVDVSTLGKLLMAKGQLALENEKFQNEVAQQKQKKQMLDQLGQHLSGLFSGTPGMSGTMGQAAGALAGAGETGGAAAALRDIPGIQKQEQATAQQKALGLVINEYAGQNVRDPGVQAELLMHAAAIDPDAAFRISEGLKNLRDANQAPTLHPMLGNDGGIYGLWLTPDGKLHSQKAADTGAKGAKDQQLARVAAAQTVQDLADIEQLRARDAGALNVPITAAMLEGAKTGGGMLSGAAGALEPLAKGRYTSNQLIARRLKLNFIDHYAAAVIGRRAAGSPATMKLVMDGFFGAAGEDAPAVQQDAARVRARTKQLMLGFMQGKPIDLSSLPGFAELMRDAQAPDMQPGAAPVNPETGTPITAQDLLNNVPK